MIRKNYEEETKATIAEGVREPFLLNVSSKYTEFGEEGRKS